jgi:hypothetical protein
MSSRKKILHFIEENKQATAKEIIDQFQLTRAMVHRHLNKLVDEKSIIKRGTPPRVYYFPFEKTEVVQKGVDQYNISEEIMHIIEKNFFFVTGEGKILSGVMGFVQWCVEREFNVEQKMMEYKGVFEKYHAYKKRNVIDGTEKIRKSFEKTCVDQLFYSAFYAWEVFGKTKMGQMVMYAKQNQDRSLIRSIVGEVRDDIKQVISDHNIESVGFIPPSIDRKVQFMSVLEKELSLDLPKINIIKLRTEIIVPQKTLSKITDRIKNAQTTIVVDEKNTYKNTLLIDDAVGSGATINETACKCKEQKVAKSVYGYAIVGSSKGFDVIQEI